jgi:hypothetical protein
LTALFLLCNAAGRPRAAAAADPDALRRAIHFLENATFGPAVGDLVEVVGIGPDAWLEQQFNLPESPMPDGLDTNQVRAQLFLNMINGRDQLRQRVMFALSQTIVVSANKTGSGPELIPWVQLLSRNAFGNYRQLIGEVTVNPTMGRYLDLAYNKKATATTSPNENYARELLQLFSIGLWELNMDGSPRRDGAGQPIPSYDQTTIREFARALTGWTFPTQPGVAPRTSNPPYYVGIMEPRSETHDTGAKTLLNGVTLPANQSTTADLLGVIDNIFAHHNVPPFIATRLIRSLVTSNPSPGYIERVARVFADNGRGVRGDLRAVVKAVLLDPEALRFTSADQGRLKDPVLHITGLGRALGARVTDPNAFMNVFNNLSQRVLTPTTVFSFYSPLATVPGRSDLFGPEFQIYPPALAIQRANFVYSLLNGSYASSFSIDLQPYRDVAASPAALVTLVDHRLMFGRMSSELRQTILTATNAIAASNTRERALGALYLAAISSEYSVSSDRFGDGLATLDPSGGPPGGAPGAPAAPVNLTGSAIGNRLTLNWQPGAGGGTPTSVTLDVTGTLTLSVPLGLTTTFSYVGVPPGTYTFRVRALNANGSSAASNPITLSFPGSGSCASPPMAPTAVQSLVEGHHVWLTWQPPAEGPAPGSYTVTVAGAFEGSFQTTEPGLAGTVAPGHYVATVQSVNECGASAPTSPVTITVR